MPSAGPAASVKRGGERVKWPPLGAATSGIRAQAAKVGRTAASAAAHHGNAGATLERAGEGIGKGESIDTDA